MRSQRRSPRSETAVADNTEALIGAVNAAIDAGECLRIVGNDTKSDLGREPRGRPIAVAAHSGIVAYEPTELVVTARAGTTVGELATVLAERRQCLAFEPPAFGGSATVAGTLACHLSGPARPWSGSVRDHVLGVTLINGRGELLRFGGQVMKNVAGFDVSRLQAGAFGVLGLMTEVTLRVHPQPERETTRVRAVAAAEALNVMREFNVRHSLLNAACWDGERLYARFAGLEAAVAADAAAFGGDELPDGAGFWASVRDQQHPFFRGDEPLWRLSVPAGTGPLLPDERWFIDWGGAQRWLRGDRDGAELQALAASVNGEASLYRGGDRSRDVAHPRDPVQQRLHKALKAALDPSGIFNPGRLYSWM